jgi:hypothetical protein
MLSKSNRGAHAEFRVALFCLGLGFEVYRNLMPNGLVDMILTRRGGHVLKCQVKSASSHSGVATAGNPRHLRQGNNDVLAICVPEGGIIFKVRNRKIQKLFAGSILARPPKQPRK